MLVTGPSFVVGRAESADLCIAGDPLLSRKHVEIVTEAGSYRIRAHGVNGAYVNGRLVAKDVAQPLFLNDWIMLSSATVLSFVADVPKMPDLTGKLLDGRFALERLIHESIKAATYAASDRELPRELAVKVLSPVLARSASYREEFRRQASAAAGLRHAHICRVLHFDEGRIEPDGGDKAFQYLCMDLLSGGTLRSRLEREPLPPLELVTTWLGAVGGALHHAHENGVVHGDIKPGCVLFDKAGTPYLGDFALASMRGDTSHSPVIGAPAFLAPEQWDGAPPTAASDQYAFGALAYRMVTGSLPFEGQDNPEVRRRNLRRGPVPAHEEALAMKRSGITEEISEVLATALRVAPAERFASVAQFVDALTGALGPSGGRRAAREPTVFVSYQRTSSTALALFLARELRDRGIRAAVDTEMRDRAIQFPEKLRNEISRCDVFVCLLGEDTLESEWVRNEIRIAREHGRPMIPIFQEGFSPKRSEPVADEVGVLLEYDGVHVLDRQGLFVDAAVEKLAKLVHGTVGRR
jgi:serine/threonine-protein kinase